MIKSHPILPLKLIFCPHLQGRPGSVTLWISLGDLSCCSEPGWGNVAGPFLCLFPTGLHFGRKLWALDCLLKTFSRDSGHLSGSVVLFSPHGCVDLSGLSTSANLGVLSAHSWPSLDSHYSRSGGGGICEKGANKRGRLKSHAMGNFIRSFRQYTT